MKNDILCALRLLTKKERRKVISLTFFQVLTGFLDLFGLLLAGAIAGVSLEHNEQGKLTVKLTNILSRVYHGHANWTLLLEILILLALLVLSAKSILNVILTKYLYNTLASALARIARETFNQILTAPYLWIKHVKNQEVGYALTDGLTYLVIGIVGSFLTGIIEVSMLTIVLFGLILINPVMAFGSGVFFFLLAATINFLVGNRVKNYGMTYTAQGSLSRAIIIDSLFLFREITLSETEDFFGKRFADSRHKSALSYSRLYWLQQVPKYIMELGIILGAALLAGLSWVTSHSSQGIMTLAVFIMAATRVVPSILRLQGVHLALKEFSGKSEKTFGLMNELKTPCVATANLDKIHITGGNKPPVIEVSKVSFSYDEATALTVRDLNLIIEAGTELTLIGSSGSGKSTICELVLGLLIPNEGTVTYDGLSISEWRRRHQSAIAYLPQDPHYFGGTIRENVTVGESHGVGADNPIWEALDLAQIGDFVRGLPLGLDTVLSDRGVQLSGGQRQRIGIARTLYRLPQVLVMDEGTSALDPMTEQALIQMFSMLSGKSTVIRVAHRLTSASTNQQVAYLEAGTLREVGSARYIQSKLPKFDLPTSEDEPTQSR